MAVLQVLPSIVSSCRPIRSILTASNALLQPTLMPKKGLDVKVVEFHKSPVYHCSSQPEESGQRVNLVMLQRANLGWISLDVHFVTGSCCRIMSSCSCVHRGACLVTGFEDVEEEATVVVVVVVAVCCWSENDKRVPAVTAADRITRMRIFHDQDRAACASLDDEEEPCDGGESSK